MKNLRKGDLIVNNDNPEIVGILIKRVGKVWHYMLTSDGILEHNKGCRISSMNQEPRERIIDGYNKGIFTIYRKGKPL